MLGDIPLHYKFIFILPEKNELFLEDTIASKTSTFPDAHLILWIIRSSNYSCLFSTWLIHGRYLSSTSSIDCLLPAKMGHSWKMTSVLPSSVAHSPDSSPSNPFTLPCFIPAQKLFPLINNHLPNSPCNSGISLEDTIPIKSIFPSSSRLTDLFLEDTTLQDTILPISFTHPFSPDWVGHFWMIPSHYIHFA